MKLLFENKRYIGSIFLTLLMVFCTSMSGYANVTPVFTDGASTTRSVAENTAAGVNIGTPVAATDADNDVLTYSLGGTDAGSFSIVSATGQLQTSTALDYETKSSYSVTVSVSDGNGGSGNIPVTISVTNVNEKPYFAPDRVTRTVAENTASGTNIGAPFQAIDPDTGDTLTYSLQRGDASSFSIDPNTGQLRTRAALDFETKNAYTDLAVRATDSTGLIGAALVRINVEDVVENNAPVFTDGATTTRSIAENTAANTNIGTPITATDANNDTLTYTLGGTDASSFSIDPNTGQLRTRAALDYETKNSYSVTLTVSDGNGGSATIPVRITVRDVAENRAPVFTDGASATRAIAENTAAGANIGTPIAATDADNDTLIYGIHSLVGTDASAFRIDGTSGQLRTKAPLDYETKNTYVFSVFVEDGKGGRAGISVSINVKDVAEKPAFAPGVITLTVAENTAAGRNIGDPITATDADGGDTLTYSLQRGDASSFSIDPNTGQLRTRAALDYGTKRSYTDLAVRATDSTGLVGSTLVRINVTDVAENNAPVFTDGSSTARSVAENTASGQNIGTPIAATDADNDTLTYTLGGTDAAAFRIVRTSGQLQTKVALDYETKSSYAVTVSVSDGNGGSDSIPVSITVTDVNENRAPVFTDGESARRAIAENTASRQNIGTPLAATDADNDTLTYSLGGAEAVAFRIVRTTGQLQTRAALDYEIKASYSITVFVSDGKGGSDRITVTINVTDVNEPLITPPLSERTPQVRDAIVAAVRGVNNANDLTAAHLAAIRSLNLSSKSISSLKAGDFNGLTALSTLDLNTNAIRNISALEDLTALTHLYLYGNAITDISVLEGLTALTNLFLNDNAISNISALEDLTSLTRLSLHRNSISDISALEDLTALIGLNLSHNSIRSISALEDLTALTSLSLHNNSISDISVLKGLTALRQLVLGKNSIRDISVLEDLTAPVSLNLWKNAISDVSALEDLTSLRELFLGGNAISDYGPLRRLKAAIAAIASHPGFFLDITIPEVTNNAPVFTDGSSATRSVAENTASGENIGAAIAATDVDTDDTLTYTLGGTDAGSFHIVSTSGQLRTRAALDYETQSSYSVNVSVSDGNGESDSIAVTITVTDANDAPVFTDGASTARAIAENTAAGENIGSAVAATDQDGDVLTYRLGGIDAASFSIVRTTGQLQTSTALDHETDDSYTVTVTATDGNGGNTDITVTIDVTDVNDAPTFTDGVSTTRAIAEKTASGQNIGAPIAATDADTEDTLTYTLNGIDAASFRIVSTSGQLQTNVTLDYETKSSYSVTVSVSDGNGGSDSIPVRIDVTNVNEKPTFSPGGIRLTVAEQTAAGTNIGKPITATDPDSGDTLTYSLQRGDKDAFRIDRNTGQLRTHVALDYETKNAYTDLAVRATDSAGLVASTRVRINVTDVNHAPKLWGFPSSRADGYTTLLTIAENTAANTNISKPVFAEDVDNDTLTYTLDGTDAAAFRIVSTTGQMQTKVALDYETKDTYSVTVSVSDGKGGSDSITVTINVTNVNETPGNSAPVFTEEMTEQHGHGIVAVWRWVAENTASGQNIGTSITATDADNDTLTYSLHQSGDEVFSIVSTTGQLQTKAALDYETKSSYSVRVSVSDGNDGNDSIDVIIYVGNANEGAPTFTDGDSTIRSIAEKTAAGTNIGDPVAATDMDRHTITFTLGGTDAASFSIVSTPTKLVVANGQLQSQANGQLQTKAALDYETKSSYSVTITASDGSLTDNIDVTINVTNANEPPVFTEGTTATRLVAENTPAGRNIGEPVAATDPDGDTLQYMFFSFSPNPDHDAFSVDSTSGQIKTKAALNFETKSSYRLNLIVIDAGGISDEISVTINVTDVDEINHAPVFTDGTSTTRSVAENMPAYTNIGTPVAATDADNHTLTYTLDRLVGTDWFRFNIVSTSGQLQTTKILDYETKSSYSVTISVSDGNGGSDSIDVTINVTDMDESNNTAPVFTEGTSTTRSVTEIARTHRNIGNAVVATDVDNNPLTYTLGGTDAASFSIDSEWGQLRTKAILDYETKSSYSVTVSVSDGNGGSDSIDVTIDITDVDESNNNIPVFREGTSTTRTIAENARAGKTSARLSQQGMRITIPWTIVWVGRMRHRSVSSPHRGGSKQRQP